MSAEEKRPYFEYLVKLLIKWHREKTGLEQNDLSTLKVLKLLFFVSAIDSSPDSNNTLVDDPFNNFYAMPYGHVESDIYDLIKKKALVEVSVTNKDSVILNEDPTVDLDNEIKFQLDKSLKNLKETNPNIILASSFELVDLSHSWYSWQYFHSKALQNGSYSHRIDSNSIKAEEKIFLV